jgi:hypothetical protein
MTEVEYSIVVDELTDIISLLPNVEMPILPQPKTDLDYLIQIDKVKHMIRFFEGREPDYKPIDYIHSEEPDTETNEKTEKERLVEFLYGYGAGLIILGGVLIIGVGIVWWPMCMIGATCIYAGCIINRYWI